MTCKKIFLRALMTVLIVVGMMTFVIVGAAVKTFNGTGYWHTSDAETPQMAMARAKQRAQLDAQKQAGVYMKDFSRTVNAVITDDEIYAVTNNIIEIFDVQYDQKSIQLNDQQTTILYTATLKARIDPDGIFDFIKRDDKDKVNIVQQNNTLQDAIQKNDKLAETLTEQYNRATTQAERDRIRKQMNQAERDFLANQKFKEGNKLYYEKNYSGAIKLNTEAIELKPDWSWPYSNRGACYNEIGQNERAIRDYDKAIQFNPNNAEAYNNRGNAYSDLGQNEQAIQDCNKAIELKPNWESPYNNRGNAYNNLGQYEQAIQDYNKAIELNPNLHQAYYNRGIAYNNLGQYERAIQDYDKAIALNPNYAFAYNNRGWAYYCMKKYQQALKDFDKAIELNPNNQLAKNNREACLKAMGK